jgi:hypothetical protein
MNSTGVIWALRYWKFVRKKGQTCAARLDVRRPLSDTKPYYSDRDRFYMKTRHNSFSAVSRYPRWDYRWRPLICLSQAGNICKRVSWLAVNMMTSWHILCLIQMFFKLLWENQEIMVWIRATKNSYEKGSGSTKVRCDISVRNHSKLRAVINLL